MASKPKTVATDDADEPLPLTSITDKLVDLPDESVVEVDVSDHPNLATAGDEEDDEGAEPTRKTPPAVEEEDEGESEQLTALRKQITEQDAAAKERLRIAEQNAENERQARLRAEQQHREQQQQTQDETSQRELALITQNLESATGQLTSLEEELARQNEAGEFKAAAATQGKIARLAAKVDRLENEKETFEANISQRRPASHEGAVRTEDSTRRTEVPATAAARLDQWLATLDPPAAKWIREHPDCAPPQLGGTQSGNAKMMAGHYKALADNVEVNSPKYFQIIESSVAATEQPPGQQQRRQQPPGARRPIPGAPPSREAPTGSQTPGRTRQVRLNRQQQEHALLSFPDLPQKEALAAYARNLVELEAEGKMGRTNV